MAERADDIEIRRAEPGDRAAILALLGSSLNWVPDAQHDDFYDWKHEQSPFGSSPAWIAEHEGTPVGFRVFMRWEFAIDGRPVRAVRAVDTATHPDHRGRGIFSKLTLHALEEVRAEGVGFVFNTPNQNSRPGYLKMGWVELGRPRVRIRPRPSPRSLLRIARRGAAADKWSSPTSAGRPAAEAFGDDAIAGLLAAQPTAGVRTPKTGAFLRWRYGFGPLHYRVLHADERRPEDGCVVFRVRRRGQALEATITDLLVAEPHPALSRRLVGRVLRETGADYAVGLAGPALRRAGMLPAPGQGPVLTWRAVNEAHPRPIEDWHLVVGDVELF
jgi:GNAT superfamily N-acetyltransferase